MYPYELGKNIALVLKKILLFTVHLSGKSSDTQSLTQTLYFHRKRILINQI